MNPLLVFGITVYFIIAALVLFILYAIQEEFGCAPPKNNHLATFLNWLSLITASVFWWLLLIFFALHILIIDVKHKYRV